MSADGTGRALADAVAVRHREVHRALAGLKQPDLFAESRLPGWDRLTIACHLRYGAIASRRMTEDTLGGRTTAFYPLGREIQRAATLTPREDETPAAVIASLAAESRRLDDLWTRVDDDDWQLPVTEPDDNRDLGTITIRTLTILRLTEVEVHGSDLDLDLAPWSDTFVSTALPMRLHWLPRRRSNHRSVDTTADGRWALIRTDGTSFLVEARGGDVEVEEGAAASFSPAADVEIVGTGQQLLRFILGRAPLSSLQVRGDRDRAASFLAAFPGP